MSNETTDIEEALRSGAVRLVPVEPNDKMMVMGGFRFAGKVPNSLVFKEVRKGWDDMLSQAPDHTPALLALIEERDRLKVERDEARQIVRDIYWMALRYADGRQTYAPGMCNDALRKAYEAGWLTHQHQSDPAYARDGASPEYQSILARALAAEAKCDALREALEKAQGDLQAVISERDEAMAIVRRAADV